MASTDNAIAAPRDHSTPKHTVQKTFQNEHLDCHERRSLQTLQQSAADDNALVGVGLAHKSSRNGKSGEKLKFKPVQGPVKVFHDVDANQQSAVEGKRVTTDSKATQTDSSLLEELIEERVQQRCKRNHSSLELEEEEAYELMVKEPVPESYWKETAEQRRLALSDTLEENKSLHEELESLKEENEKLSELASQAEYLSSLLQSVVSDDKNKEKNEEEQAENDVEPENHNNTTSDSDNVCLDTSSNHKLQTNIETCSKDTEISSSKKSDITEVKIIPSQEVPTVQLTKTDKDNPE